MKPEEHMLISAVRYALGRMTYIVGMTCDFIEVNRKKLSKDCISIILMDVMEEIDLYHRLGKTCGMEIDERRWRRLVEVLESELE
jgi:hypothetical protein